MMKRKFSTAIPVGKFGTNVFINLKGVNGTDEDYVTIPGVSEFTFSADMSVEEFEDWLQSNFTRKLATGKSHTFEMSVTCYKDEPTYNYFENIMVNVASGEEAVTQFKWVLLSGATYEAYVIVNPSSMGGGNKDVLVMDITLEVDGEPECTPAEEQTEG